MTGQTRELAPDIATVVFRRELPLLRIQARSFARYLAPGAVNRIFVIVNDVDEAACMSAVEAMSGDYGPHSGRLTVLPAGALMAWPSRRAVLRARLSHLWRRLRGRSGTGWQGRSGWYMQQALKLAVARVAEAPVTVLLDAKNHLLSPCDASVFVGEGGKPRAEPVVLDDYHFDWRRNAHAFLSCPPPPRDAPALPTTTPFPVLTEDLAATLAEVEARGGPVQTYFRARRPQTTEFTLIDALCTARHGGWAQRFTTGLPPANTIYRNAGPDAVAQFLEAAESGACRFFGVHREARSFLSEADRDRVLSIWRAHELIDADTDPFDTL